MKWRGRWWANRQGGRWCRWILVTIAVVLLHLNMSSSPANACTVMYEGGSSNEGCGGAAPIIGAVGFWGAAVVTVCVIAILKYIRGAMTATEMDAVLAQYFTAPAVPQGVTAEQFRRAATILRTATAHIGGIPAVQGSRAAGTASPASDIDFAIRVPPERFDDLVRACFGAPNPGSAKERTMLWAIETGKIQAGEARLGALRRALRAELGLAVDLSIVRMGGPFDKPPFIEVP